MITLAFCYWVAGIMFAIFAIITAFDSSNAKRWTSAMFWALLATSFLAGDYLGDLGNGLLVLGLLGIAGTGQLGKGAQPGASEADKRAQAAMRGNRIFLPALIIPAVALIGTLAFKHWPTIADPKQATLIALAFGVLITLAACLAWLRPGLATPFRDGHRLMEQVGWAAILPQMLASLGAVFAAAGVGQAVGGVIGGAIPHGSLLGAVIVYGLGMALFTIVMGNAFAAFPVMAGAIGVPILIHQQGGDPAVIAAIGMLAGFCGTLMTPMAANFNLVPAALLELKDRYGVIRMQIGTAVPMLIVNIAFIYWFGFR